MTGGNVEYISFETPDRPLVKLADGTLFPETATLLVYVREEEQEVEIHAEVSLEVHDGRPIVVRVAVARGIHSEGRWERLPLTPTMLHDLNFGKIFDRAIRHGGYIAVDADTEFVDRQAASASAQRAAALARRRQPLTDALLAQVVNIVRHNKYDPRKQVASMLYVSERTASRWIAEARRRGLLDEEVAADE